MVLHVLSYATVGPDRRCVVDQFSGHPDSRAFTLIKLISVKLFLKNSNL